MTAQKRQYLRQETRNGSRPDEQVFADLMDSFVNLEDDGVSFEEESGSLVLSSGLVVGNSDSNTPGTLRFNGVNFEYFDGTDWTELGGGGESVFQPSGTGGEVAYSAGNVGIGDFVSPPSHKLDVNLGENTDPTARVRFGNVICSNGTGTATADAFFYHQDMDTSNTYAVCQRSNGELRLNTPSRSRIRFLQNGNTPRLVITGEGHVVVGFDSDIPSSGGATFQVNGSAFKSNGNDMWDNTSDARVKKDIRELELGLDEIRRIRPVRYRYTGAAGTPKDHDSIGIIGQEIEDIIPDTIKKVSANSEGESELDDLRIYNGSSLTYVLINSVKELADLIEKQQEKINELEKQVSQNGTGN